MLRDMVRIQLCGRFAVAIDGQPAESRFPGRRGRLLVAYLAAHRVQPVERTVLTDVLWPEGGAGAAGALTVLLSKVRTLLVPAEIRGRGTLQLVLPEDSAVDLEMATTSLHSADAAAALAAYDQLRQLLREELGVSPCPATQVLHARLLRGQPLDEPSRAGHPAG